MKYAYIYTFGRDILYIYSNFTVGCTKYIHWRLRIVYFTSSAVVDEFFISVKPNTCGLCNWSSFWSPTVFSFFLNAAIYSRMGSSCLLAVIRGKTWVIRRLYEFSGIEIGFRDSSWKNKFSILRGTLYAPTAIDFLREPIFHWFRYLPNFIRG